MPILPKCNHLEVIACGGHGASGGPGARCGAVYFCRGPKLGVSTHGCKACGRKNTAIGEQRHLKASAGDSHGARGGPSAPRGALHLTGGNIISVL